MSSNFENGIYYYLSLIHQLIPSDTNISTTNIVIPFFTPAVTLLDVLLDIVIIILCVILIIYPPNSQEQEQEQEQALPPETIQDIMNRVLLGIDHNDVDFFDDDVFFDDYRFNDLFPIGEPPILPAYSLVDPNPPPAYPYLSPAQKRKIIGILNKFRQRRNVQTRNGGSLSGGGNIQISTFLKNTINVFKNEFKNIIIVNDQKEKITQVEEDILKISEDEKKKYFTHYCLLFLKILKNNKEQLRELKTKPLNAEQLQEITFNGGGGRKKKRTLRKKKKNKKKKSRRSRRLQSKKKSI